MPKNSPFQPMSSPFWSFLLVLVILKSANSSEEESGIGKFPHQEDGEAREFDAAGCNMTKGCLLKPATCTPHKDCVYAMSYVADNERIYFELLGQVAAEKNSYVAMGFSVDGLMGGDTVTDCSSFEGGPFSARLSYNPGKSNRKVPLEAEKEKQILRTHSTQYADGVLYCRFSQLIQPLTNIQPQFVRPLNSPIFILMSSGTTRRNDELMIHSLNADSPLFPFSSPTPIDLTMYKFDGTGWPSSSSSLPPSSSNKNESAVTTTQKSADSFSLGKMAPDLDGEGEPRVAQQKAHGVLMLLSWLLLAPFAILSARFLHHEKLELLGLHLWFQIHRAANSLAFLLVLISLLCVLASLNADWIGPAISNDYYQNLSVRSLHALFGAAAILLTICQPLNALFRCAPHSPARFIFGWLHSIIGYSAWLFSVISISIACLFFNNTFLDWFIARDLLIASLALIIVSFSVLQWFSHRRNSQLKESQRNGQNRGNTNSPAGFAFVQQIGRGSEGQKEGLLIQRAILGLFLAMASILCLALCLLLILA